MKKKIIRATRNWPRYARTFNNEKDALISLSEYGILTKDSLSKAEEDLAKYLFIKEQIEKDIAHKQKEIAPTLYVTTERSISDICNRLRISKDRLYRILNEFDIPLREGKPKRKGPADRQRLDGVRKMLADGRTQKEIADAYDISPQAVSSFIKRHLRKKQNGSS